MKRFQPICALSIIVTVLSSCGQFEPFTDIHLAAFSGSPMAVRQALLAGEDIDETDGNGQTALTIAVNQNDIKMVEFLLKMGADPDKGYPISGTVYKDNQEMVDVFLEYGANCIPAVMVVAGQNEPKKIQYLLDKGTHKGYEKLDVYNVALVAASLQNATKTIHWLLDQGAEVDPFASGNVLETSTKAILDFHSFIDTPIKYAALGGHSDLIKLYHDKGASLDGAFYHAVLYDQFETADYVVALGVDLKREEESNPTIIHKCISNNKNPIPHIEYLHMHQFDFNQIDPMTGNSPLLLCAERGKADVLRKLVEYGVDIDQFNARTSKNTLNLAVQSRDIETIKTVLELGGKPLLDSELSTEIVIEAVNKRYLEMVKLLIEFGADPLVKDLFGKTALDYAREFEDQEMIDLLTNTN